MKKILWTMAAAVALVGCSNEDLLNVDNNEVQNGNAIAFSTYVGDNAQTRASVIYNDDLKLDGFGVNAYYTGQSEFDGDTEYTGNAIFMDNTKVTFNPEKEVWTYSPVKYWPNNEGDMLSFFAYAPYNSGAIQFNEANRSKLNFTVENDVLDQVDLIYHIAEGNEGKNCEKTIELTKPSVNSKVAFNFHHALSRITFDVQAVVDETDPAGDNLLDGNTRINIKKVALVKGDDEEGTEAPFYTTGTLNLQNGEWNTESSEYQEFTFNGYHFYQPVNEEGTENEENYVVQLTKFNPAQTLLNEDSYLMIIPNDFSQGDKGYRIYIEYDVISEEVENNGSNENSTNDSNTITNKIYSAKMTTNFEQGKAYKFTLLLGMTSVKFDAAVAAWEDAEDYDNEEWLPENLKGTPGSADNPYLIASLDDLEKMVNDINNENTPVEGGVPAANAYYLQTANIDMSEKYNADSESWSTVSKDFSGTYDGGGYEIQNFYSSHGGMFYKLTETGIVKSIKITNGTISELSYGGIVGANYGTVLDCSFSGTVSVNDDSYNGTIVADNYGDVIHCYFAGSFSQQSDWNWNGAIVGRTLEDSRVIACYNIGTTSGHGSGAIIGYHDMDSDGLAPKAIACYNIGEIQASEYVEPITGVDNNDGLCIGCYNTGETNTNSQISADDNANTACYFDATNGQTSQNTSEIGVDGSNVTWQIAMEAMNSAIKAELGADTPYIFVLNTNETTKEKMPLIHKVDSSDE